MRLLQRFTPLTRLLRFIRSNAETGQRALLIVGPSRDDNREFLRGMLLGCLEAGHTLGVCEPGDEALHLPGMHWVVRYELEQQQILRAFARQDPDSVLVSELQQSALEIFLTLMLTGHAAGSIATVVASGLAELPEWLGENSLGLDGCLLAQLHDGTLNHLCLVEGPEWVPLYTIRELDFDAERDPARFDEYTAHKHVFSPKFAELESPSALPVLAPVQKPEDETDLPPRELMRPCWLVRFGEHQPALLKQCEDGADWPELLGRPGLLLLQLAPEQLAHLQLGVEPGGWLQLFYAARPDDIEDFTTPQHSGFLVRRTPAPIGGVAILHESFPVTELEPHDDFPDYADAPEMESRGNQRGTKLGGWPSWRQHADTPACPQCSTPMRFVFQFSNRTLAETATGGDFADYLFVCERHLDEWAMAHQCT